MGVLSHVPPEHPSNQPRGRRPRRSVGALQEWQREFGPISPRVAGSHLRVVRERLLDRRVRVVQLLRVSIVGYGVPSAHGLRKTPLFSGMCAPQGLQVAFGPLWFDGRGDLLGPHPGILWQRRVHTSLGPDFVQRPLSNGGVGGCAESREAVDSLFAAWSAKRPPTDTPHGTLTRLETNELRKQDEMFRKLSEEWPVGWDASQAQNLFVLLNAALFSDRLCAYSTIASMSPIRCLKPAG